MGTEKVRTTVKQESACGLGRIKKQEKLSVAIAKNTGFSKTRLVMAKVKKLKTLISDFDVQAKLDKLREEVPNIAHNLFPLYATCAQHMKRHDGAPDYWIPKSVQELQDHIESKIYYFESGDRNFDEAEAYITSAGIRVGLHVEGRALFASVTAMFGYELL